MSKEKELQFTNLAYNDGESRQHIVSREVIGTANDGIYVKKATIVGLAVLAVVVAAAVGIIVHFAVPRNCEEVTPTLSPDQFWERCVEESQQREECLPGVFPCPETTSPQVTTTSSPPVRELVTRLSTDVSPLSYNIYLKPDFYQASPDNFNTEGQVTMKLVCQKETNLVNFHFADMVLKEMSIQVTDSSNQAIDIDSTEAIEADNMFKIYLSRNLSVSEEVNVYVEFSYPLKETPKNGLYWNDYPENGEIKYMLATQFEPARARRAFPCMDEPNLKAKFTVTLARKTWMTALTNAPRIQTVSKENNWVEDIFEETAVVMPTYLMAFAIANFTYIEDTATGGLTTKPLRFWAEPRYISAGFADYAKEKSAPGYDFFESHFDHPYRMPKTDQIQVPDFASGAMENWGLITYVGSRLLFDKDVSQEYEKQRALGTIMHELLHQWMGNVVTCAWWSDIWLNEAFARYYQHMAMKLLEPTWDIDQIYAVQSVQRALGYDQTGTRHPIYNPMLYSTGDFSSMFSSVTYDKGGAILRMTQTFVIKDSWNASMRYYVDKLQYQAAEHDDLFAVWEEQLVRDNREDLEVNVTEYMYTWIKQSGYPMVTVERMDSGATTSIKASQQLFLIMPDRPLEEKYPSPYGYNWEIPLSYVTKDTLDSMKVEWMHKTNITFDMGVKLEKNEWVLANYRQLGFYRVNYDAGNWAALASQLESDHLVIDVLSRGQLINDAFAISRAGHLNITTALDVTKYLKNEKENLPWNAAWDGLIFVERIFASDHKYVHMRDYMRGLLERLYEEFGWNVPDGESHPKIYARERILMLACKYQVGDCVDVATQKFAAWRQEPDKESLHINPNVKDAVYCTAIAHGSEEDWDFLLEHYVKFFRMALEADDRILTTDRSVIMATIARNPNGNLLAWEYLNTAWSPSVYSSLLIPTVESYSTQYELEKVKELLNENVPSDDLRKQFDSILDGIKENIKWRDANEESIFAWFEKQKNGPEATPERLRLPLNLLPSHYDVVLRPDIYQASSDNFTFNGSVSIDLECVSPTAVIIVHFRQMKIDDTSVQITSDSGTPVTMSRAEIVEDLEFYKIHTSRLIQPGEKLKLFLTFSAKLGNSQAGMYWSDYPDNGETKYMVATQFEASDARKAFPCLDEPALKATFNVTLFRKSWMVALSNGPLIQSIPHQDDWVEDVFEKTTVVMPTYLVAFAIANYTYIEDTANQGLTEKKIRFFAEPRYISAGFAEYAKEISAPSFDFFEKLFDYPYEMQKTDQIQIPDFAAGAMENWGLITYRGSRLLYDPELTSEYEKQRMSGTVYHELLHQWLGNIVTCAWWSDIWLNEAFARYYQHWSLRHVNSDWDIDQIYAGQSIFRALDYDSTGARHPLHNPVLLKASDFDAMFSAVTYDKGGVILRMAHNFLLKDSWNASMNYYIKKMAYEAADYNDLLLAWEEQLATDGAVLDMNVTEFMYTWIMQMGYPLVTLSRESGNKVSATQRLYLLDPMKPIVEKYPSPYNYQWEVPISYVTSVNTMNVETEWLHRENRTFTLPSDLNANDWILANYHQFGFFRVNYDEQNWNSLINQLNSNFTVINVLNRGQLLDDAFALGRSGELDSTVAMRLTQYMKSEREYLPWYAARLGISFIDRILVNSPYYIQLRTYLLDLVTPAYKEFGWNLQEGDSHPKIYLREYILRLACQYGHQGCIDYARLLLQDWKNNPLNQTIVNKDIRVAVYITAIENGGEEEWDFLFDRYQYYASNDHFSTQRTDLRNALSFTRQKWLLERFFLMALNNDARLLASDRSSIMAGIARNPIGNDIVWEYMHSRPSEIPQSIYAVLCESYSTMYDLNRVIGLLEASALSSSAQESILTVITANIRWKNKNEEKIFTWLEQTI